MSLRRHRLAAARQAAGHSQESLAGRLGVDRSTVQRWEAGETTPRAWYWPKLITALGISHDQLAELLVSTGKRSTLTNEIAGWPLGGVSARDAAAALWSQEDADSSPVDNAMQTASHSVVFKWLVHRHDVDVASLPSRDSSRQVSRDDIAALLAMSRSLKNLDDEHGGGAALPMALKYLTSEVAPLLHSRYNERIGRALFGAAAELALCTGWMAYDAGQHGQARKQMLNALRLSQVAGDRPFGGRVLAAMSHQALHLGQFRDGIDFATAAMKGARASGLPAAVALFAASEARAHAASGDRQTSLTRMRTAERVFARANSADGPAWLSFMDEAELAGKFGRCLRDLGLHREAKRYLATSLALHKTQYPRSRAITKIIYATNYARKSELEPACQLGLEALPDIGRIRSQRTKEYLTDLCRGLDPYRGEPLVASFREQARHLLVRGRA